MAPYWRQFVNLSIVGRLHGGYILYRGGLLKYIFKYLFIFTYIIIKGISLGNALQLTN